MRDDRKGGGVLPQIAFGAQIAIYNGGFPQMPYVAYARVIAFIW